MGMKRTILIAAVAIIVTVGLSFGSQWARHDVWPVGVPGADTTAEAAPVPAISDTELKAAGGPVHIFIPSIGVDADIEHVGRTSKNDIGIPKDFDNTAWFTESALPGATGSAVIDGHVNDRLSLPAVFANLDKLVVGDKVIVKYESGLMVEFAVKENASYDLNSAPIARILGPSEIPQLNLITCTGTWVQSAKMYDKRRVVYTQLVGRI
jgi:sortase (surface protein transpeptidase)